MKERIGVYICHCGGNISDYVDVEELSKMLKEEKGVVIAKDVMFACADSNQKAMIQDIQELQLDSIVVASCSPKLHLHTFKNVAERAGLNPSNYVQVNIREQCSWAHSDKPREATVKAVGLIRAGINRVTHSEALENIDINVTKAALVIGAGVSGMRAAIDLARLGNEVYLVEKEYFVGGRAASLGNVFISEHTGQELVSKLYEEIKKLPNITLFPGASVEKVTGSMGNFNVDVVINPRYIKGKPDSASLLKAIDECPANIPDEYNFGMSNRKAICKRYPNALPNIPVVDVNALKDNSAFLNKYADCIDLTQMPETISLNIGSILVSTGFAPYMPKEGEYAYKTSTNVITLPQFKRLVELCPDKLAYNNKVIKKVAFIYCVGSRQTKGENKYCSRVCCTATVHTSLTIKEKYKDIKAFHLFRDIRTYGKQEIMYETSSKQGDIYIRYEEKEPPVVEQQGNQLIVKVKDYLTSKKELEIEADLVVLVTGMTAREDSTDIAQKLKIPVGGDKFFNEIHPKLKPVETVIKGTYIGGCCQGPKNITESVQSTLSASAKINALLKSGTLTLKPVVARVNNDTCTWCGKCAGVCEYDAIKAIDYNGKQVAGVNKATCTGCGICAPVCPVNAIEIAQYTDMEIEGMIDGFMAQVVIAEKSEGAETKEEKDIVGMKEYPQLWKDIIARIGTESKSIPQVAEELGVDKDIVTYNMMTMNKYGVLMSAGTDKKETYFFYKLKNQ